MRNTKRSIKLCATALALWTLCSAGSCTKEVHSVSAAFRPDQTNPERFVCEPAGTRPLIDPDYSMNWQFVGSAATVAEAAARAKAEHDLYVKQERARELVVAKYVMLVEDKLFLCFNNMTWQKDFYSNLPVETPER